MMVWNTSSNGHAPTYQLILTYLERRQCNVCPIHILPIHLPWGLRSLSNEVMLVRDILSNWHAPAYQISFTFVQKKKNQCPEKLRYIVNLYLTFGWKVKIKKMSIRWYATHRLILIHRITNIDNLSLKSKKEWSGNQCWEAEEEKKKLKRKKNITLKQYVSRPSKGIHNYKKNI